MISIRCKNDEERDIKKLLKKFKKHNKKNTAQIILDSLLIYEKYQGEIKKAVASVWK